MPFSISVREEALVACGRHCCLCHRFVGTKIECHHIQPESEGGKDVLENCIPLCFDCHADVQHYNPLHPKGTRFRPEELRAHRDRWIKGVSSTNSAIFDSERRVVDRSLFERFREVLPEETARQLLSEQCWGQLIHVDVLDRVYEIDQFLARLDSEFLDPTCEGFRAAFSEGYRRFVHHNDFMQISRVDGIADHFRLPKEWNMSSDPEVRNQFSQCMNNLNQLSSEAYRAYTEMIREIRKLLIII